MDENKNKSTIVSPALTQVTPSVINPPLPSAQHKLNIARIWVIIGVICGLFLACVAVYIVFAFVTGTHEAVSEISQSCNQVQEGNTTTRNQFKSQLSTIKIDGQTPGSMKSYGGAQCFEGSSPIVVTAVYPLSAANVTDANMIVLKTFPGSTQKPFAPTTKVLPDGNAVLVGVNALITTAGKSTYSVGYTFASAVQCQLNGRVVSCDVLTNTIESYNLLNQPIVSVTIGLSK